MWPKPRRDQSHFSCNYRKPARLALTQLVKGGTESLLHCTVHLSTHYQQNLAAVVSLSAVGPILTRWGVGGGGVTANRPA